MLLDLVGGACPGHFSIFVAMAILTVYIINSGS